jgi:hypothetical protein
VHTSSIPNQVLNQFFFTLIIICFQRFIMQHAYAGHRFYSSL